MGLLFELLMSLVRRRRWALYLAVGLRRTDLCLIAAGRTLILLSVASLGSLAVAAAYATDLLPDGVTQEIVRAGVIQGVLFSAVTLLLTPLTLAVLTGMSMVESLRE